MIVDGILGANGFPYGLVRETEFESVRAKPLGNAFVGVPLRG